MSPGRWKLRFLAEAEEVAALRSALRVHLGRWDLEELIETAQLCVSELVSNVITHVGPGTPAELIVSKERAGLRIEVHDPDTRALPTLRNEGVDSESGRGMDLITAVTDRWGVQLLADKKVTWCELTMTPVDQDHPVAAPGVTRAEALLDLYAVVTRADEPGSSRLGTALAEEAVIDVITDFLHWLRAHGSDEEEVLDRAQRRFENRSAMSVVN
ncbi:ATP-binding protein [Streptomyces tauricus]|uniref:ATP-binding protein n=1 Tax=Streptomyces tauricus TaxID=68274 RepID=A0ABZ1JMG3_9ACTN|nr:ATP-binding protein [Streptomyces tauricus]MCW8098545.1 ATP-binding protein [Streptomyces tauricus]